jgi:DNA-binding CsgD family transcriptional regulator
MTAITDRVVSHRGTPEVARLAATGMTSRAISELLTLSVRTVDNALRGVYAKLRVSGRRELAELDLG